MRVTAIRPDGNIDGANEQRKTRRREPKRQDAPYRIMAMASKPTLQRTWAPCHMGRERWRSEWAAGIRAKRNACADRPRSGCAGAAPSCIPVEQSFCAQPKNPPAPHASTKEPIHEHEEKQHRHAAWAFARQNHPVRHSAGLKQHLAAAFQFSRCHCGRSVYRLDRACRHRRRVAGHHAADRPVRRAFHRGERGHCHPHRAQRA